MHVPSPKPGHHPGPFRRPAAAARRAVPPLPLLACLPDPPGPQACPSDRPRPQACLSERPLPQAWLPELPGPEAWPTELPRLLAGCMGRLSALLLPAWRPAAWLLAALFVAGAGLPAQETAPLPRQGELVGQQECARCHDRQHRRLLSGAHAAVLQVPQLQGCETCHGPGAAHAAGRDPDPALITQPALLGEAMQAALCRRCHGDQVDQHGGDPAGFRAAGLRCTDCHAVHGKPPEPVQPDLRFDRRTAADAGAEPLGSSRCVDCHPLRDRTLQQGPHRSLAAAADPHGCERCHGEGSLHGDRGEGRFITRPDRAADGIATCRQCHQEVDAEQFHWRGKRAPYLDPAGITCTTCHRVHEPPDAAAGAAAAADAAAGADVASNRLCAGCHGAAFATMPGSIHRAQGRLDAPLQQGCGSCHLGALQHAGSGGKKELLQPFAGDARAEAAACLQCHGSERALQHVHGGSHLQRGVACSDCHGPLHGARNSDVAAAAERRCGECHPAVAAQFRLPNHHPVPEGRMRCSSCHDVHQGRRRARDLELAERRCGECHPRYRGPFVYAHQAGRRDGCVACHLPHGSSNRRLLQQATTQQNCLQCHADFPAFHDQTPGAVFTDCIRCHTEVHGSDHSRYLFR